MTATRKPTVDLDRTRDLLGKLGLTTAAERIEDLLSVAAKEDEPSHRFLDRVLQEELGQREERRVRTSLKLSSLPQGQTLASFDFVPAWRRAQPNRAVSHLRLHPREVISADPGPSWRRKDPPRSQPRR